METTGLETDLLHYHLKHSSCQDLNQYFGWSLFGTPTDVFYIQRQGLMINKSQVIKGMISFIKWEKDTFVGRLVLGKCTCWS